MTTPAAVKKDTQKLQRAIVDGLESVKAQDIQVFDTEHLSALFERVIVASGTSNRQTKALASSVRDAVRDAGFAKPRIEGESNGEWIIVDCGQAVVHIMQPTYRTYYNLENLWGEKPVRLKLGAAKPAVKTLATPAAPATGKKPLPNIKRSSAAKKGALELNPPKSKKPKAALPKPASAKPASAKAATAKSIPAKKPVAKKTAAKTVASNQASAKKTSAKKMPAKKSAPRKA